MSRTDERLTDAKNMLQLAEELLEKYPKCFSLELSVKQWKREIQELEKE